MTYFLRRIFVTQNESGRKRKQYFNLIINHLN